MGIVQWCGVPMDLRYAFLHAGGAGGVKGMMVMLLKKIYDICNQVVGWWTDQEGGEKEEEDGDMKERRRRMENLGGGRGLYS